MSKQKRVTGRTSSLKTTSASPILLAGSIKSGPVSSGVSAGSELIGRSSISGHADAQPIHFGSPSNAGKASTSNAGSMWQQLVPSSPTGAARLLRGGVLGLVGDLLFSGLGSLFGGGKSSPPPLVKFSLPGSTNTTVELNRSGSTGASAASPFASPATYTNQNTQIVQAVREALLTSSQLNDVISEI